MIFIVHAVVLGLVEGTIPPFPHLVGPCIGSLGK